MDYKQYIKYPEADNVDFENYLKSYPDLHTICRGNLAKARQHWLLYGRHEGRNIKLKNINYGNIVKYIESVSDNIYPSGIKNHITLTTSLYNEMSIERVKELCICLNYNINCQHIHAINIHYDISTNDIPGEFKVYFDSEKVNLIPCTGRPTFETLFYNSPYKDLHVVCNGDIIITSDILKLDNKKLNQTVICLTRWEFISDNDICIFHANNDINTISQDTWIHNKTLPYIEEFKNIYLGTNACDCIVGNILRENNIQPVNPCIDIKTLHLHLQNQRSNTCDTQHLSDDLFDGEWPRVNHTPLSRL